MKDQLNPCEQVRTSCSYVSDQSSFVKINHNEINKLAENIIIKNSNKKNLESNADINNGIIEWDSSGWHYLGTQTLTAQYIFVLDTLNFCFWPSNSGLEYAYLATTLKCILESDSTAFQAEKLANMSEETVSSWFAELPLPLLSERVSCLRELGQVLMEDFNGLAINVIKLSNGSAMKLVKIITRFFSRFRDTAIYKGRLVHFYKRAQILVGDLWAAFGKLTHTPPLGQTHIRIDSNIDTRIDTKKDIPINTSVGSTSISISSGIDTNTELLHPCSFFDINSLTMFADYRVPQILRSMNILEYSPDLCGDIDALLELPWGGEKEVEIRAQTIVAVELLQLAVKNKGLNMLVLELDWYLWQEGEDVKDALLPHHRTLSIYY